MRKTLNILLIIATFVLTYFLVRQDKRLVQDMPQIKDLKVDTVVKVVDKRGNEHAIISEKDNIIQSLKQVNGEARKEIDSVTKLLNIKNKQLKEYISYSATIKDSLLEAKRINDSLFTYKSKDLEINFKPFENGGFFDFKYDAKINYATYWKRDWIFGKKKGYIDFWISDPRATINGVKRLKIEQPQKSFGLNINASSYYDYNLHSGIDGEVNIGRAKLGGGYFYDFGQKDWHPVFSAKYNLLDL